MAIVVSHVSAGPSGFMAKPKPSVSLITTTTAAVATFTLVSDPSRTVIINGAHPVPTTTIPFPSSLMHRPSSSTTRIASARAVTNTNLDLTARRVDTNHHDDDEDDDDDLHHTAVPVGINNINLNQFEKIDANGVLVTRTEIDIHAVQTQVPYDGDFGAFSSAAADSEQLQLELSSFMAAASASASATATMAAAAEEDLGVSSSSSGQGSLQGKRLSRPWMWCFSFLVVGMLFA
ncbi:hypothetical protein KCU88_g4070, partial [Aureobasidium melanogenum]